MFYIRLLESGVELSSSHPSQGGLMELVVTAGITVWYGNTTQAGRRAPSRVIGTPSLPRTPFIHSAAGREQRKSWETLPTQLVLRSDTNNQHPISRPSWMTQWTRFWNSRSETEDKRQIKTPQTSLLHFNGLHTRTQMCVYVVYFGGFICAFFFSSIYQSYLVMLSFISLPWLIPFHKCFKLLCLF